MDSRTTRIIATVLVVALIGLGFALVLRGGGSTPTRDRGAPGWVVVDGWSWAMRDGRDLEVLVDGNIVEASFSPVTEKDLEELLELQPSAVTNLAARVATADPSLQCNAVGCTTSTGAVELASVVAPDNPMLAAAGVSSGAYIARVGSHGSLTLEVRVAGEERGARLNMRPDLGPPEGERQPTATYVPGAGDVLTVPPPGAVGEERSVEEIEALIENYNFGDSPGEGQPSTDVPAQGIHTPGGGEGVTAVPGPPQLDEEIPVTIYDDFLPPDVGADDAELVEVLGVAVLSDNTTDTSGGLAETVDELAPEVSEADPHEPLPPVLVAGLAWGTMLPLDTPWLTTDSLPDPTPFGVTRTHITPVDSEPAEHGAPFTAGLAVTDTAAAELTASQLTAWSAPLTGCGIGVVCAPTAEGVDVVDNTESVTTLICYALELEFTVEGVDGTQEPLVEVTAVLRDRTMSFDGASRIQLGAWDPAAETPANSLWPVPVPVNSEPFTLQVRTVEVYDAAGLVTLAGSQSPAPQEGVWDIAAVLASGAGNVLRSCS